MNPFEDSDFEFALERHRAVREEQMRERDYEKWQARQRHSETEEQLAAELAARRLLYGEQPVEDVPPVETEWDRERLRRELRHG